MHVAFQGILVLVGKELRFVAFQEPRLVLGWDLEGLGLTSDPGFPFRFQYQVQCHAPDADPHSSKHQQERVREA